MSKNLSGVFKDAKKYLWDGTPLMLHDDDKEEYICYAIGRTAHSRELKQKAAAEIVLSRLGFTAVQRVHHTVESYLIYVVGVSREEVEFDKPRVQKYRKDWLTSLEKEFKPKLKPKKGFSVHHIDGDLNNNDSSNLMYVKTQG